jgi:catechol 2,3-dioxygenase-like lactoylglutathione lyase family enzyme
MSLLSGLNHVALMTSDLDRFVAFYTGIFDMTEVFREQGPGFRHAILRMSPNSWLHPAEVPGNRHAAGIPQMFVRGHLDHIALTASSREAFDHLCGRLQRSGSTDGKIEDLGAFHSLWFTDPDGMRSELTLVVDPMLRGIHAPRPLVR